MPFMFENLLVYQKAVDFADRIASRTETFPRGYYFLVDQLNRAALSIATNLAEDANERYFTAREIKTDLQRKAVTNSTICPACRQVNKVREPHCSQCAAALTEVMPGCLNCGKVNRLGSRFCTQCGVRLR